MAALTYFTVTGTYLASLRDSVYDVDNDPELTPMTGTITFTPLFNAGDSVPAFTLTPPATLWLVPVKTQIRGGKITTNGVNGVKLTANTPVLNLQGDLFYRVDFYDGLTAGGRTYHPASFTFQAPTSATLIDLVSVSPAPGVVASGSSKGDPGFPVDDVQLVGNTIQFFVQGSPIGDPLPVTVTGVPSNFDNLTDATTVGKALGRAATQAAARQAISAADTSSVDTLIVAVGALNANIDGGAP